jgi:hypothetical protein
MKEATAEKVVRALICACVFFLGYFVVGFLVSLADGSAPATAEMDEYEVRSALLMEATDSVGACGPEEAARVWAEGLKRRSAAMQYAVMTKALKDKYAKQLEATFPNWVTGVSSPWVQGYEIMEAKMASENEYAYRMLFSTASSSGPAGAWEARLTVVKDGDYWRVSKVDADRELDVYTGFDSK